MARRPKLQLSGFFEGLFELLPILGIGVGVAVCGMLVYLLCDDVLGFPEWLTAIISVPATIAIVVYIGTTVQAWFENRK